MASSNASLIDLPNLIDWLNCKERQTGFMTSTIRVLLALDFIASCNNRG